MFVDLADIWGMSRWYLRYVENLLSRERTLSRNELETILIEIEVQFLYHLSYHLKSLRRLVPQALAALGSGRRRRKAL